jgi:1-acyl-sn-glycerol-3-phosphate acyltransferase
MTAAPQDTLPRLEDVEQRVLDVVRGLAEELGGPRAARAVTADASLEREVGLGSLERVELLLRLESSFGRGLDEAFLQVDTARGLARMLADGAGAAHPARPRQERGASLAAPAAVAPAATVHEALWRRAQAHPDRPHIYLREDDGREETITYGALLGEAAAVAGGMRERGVRKGDTVALMLPTGRDFLAAFQGILICGAVPVPIYPPVRLDRLEEYARRQSGILSDAGVRLLVTIDRARPVVDVLRPSVPSLLDVSTVAELGAIGRPWSAPEGEAADPAFVQYTSGSTGAPKGVLLTHANLLANIEAIARGLDARPTDVGASWLPLYHDMGLIGSWLFCMHAGLPLALMSPLAFLSRPERWLWTIHERRATLSAAPNFAYELCVRKVPDQALEGLDLSSWRVALNGAEPVNPDTLERFVKRFGPHGFRRESLFPVYGLAENSVAVCFPPIDRGPLVDRVARGPFEQEGRADAAAEEDPHALRFVSVGPAVAGHEVRLVDETGRDVPERTVGRLVFRGPSMTAGYFRQPEATAAITTADGFLDSGDLAYRVGDEIFITGRRKDLIIKAGRNLVPQEIEEVASSVPGIRKGCVVAFGVPQPSLGTEGLVVVAETRTEDPAERDRLAAAITERVAAAVGVPPDRVVLAPPGAVPKTSSGKIRRAATRDLYLEGRLGRPERTPRSVRLRLVLSAGAAAARRALGEAGRLARAVWLAATLAVSVLVAWPILALVRRQDVAHSLQRRAARLVLWAAGCRLTVEGLDRLQAPGPFIVASNHTSYADVVALAALLPRRVLFVAKDEMLRWPLLGLLLRRAGHLTVERWSAGQSVSDAGKLPRALEEGSSVLVFPEGTFTAAAGLRPFRLGAFKAAVDTGTPVIPVALRGARRVLGDGSWVPRPGTIHLRVGAPVAPEGVGWQAVVALRDRVAAEIAEHCGEPRLDLLAGGPVRGQG